MSTDPRRRKGDWSVNAELLREEIEYIWPVRVHVSSAYHAINQKKNLWVVEVVAVFVPPLEGYPHSVHTMVPVDRQYLTPYDRALYMGLYRTWLALDALDVPLRARPPVEQ